MKIFLVFLLFVYVGDGMASNQSQNGKVVVERGGFLSRLTHRARLRELSLLIIERKISYEQLKDYLEKGGSPDIVSNYDLSRDFFVGSSKTPVLNYFIRRFAQQENPELVGWAEDGRSDLMRSFKLLLDNGANPNVSAPGESIEDISPLLFATWTNDKEAMQMLIESGADINTVQRLSVGLIGPALIVAKDDAAADIIFKQKPNTSVKNIEDRNMAQELLLSSQYSSLPSHILSRLQWMEKNKLSFSWNEGSPDDPVKRAQWMATELEKNPRKDYPKESSIWKEIAQVVERLKSN